MSLDKKFWDLSDFQADSHLLKLQVRGLVRMRLYEIDPSKHAPSEVIDSVADMLLAGECVAVGLAGDDAP